jgi:hypothetical protein
MSKEYWEIPEPSEHPCTSCKITNCTYVCFTRWRWWDAALNRVRKKFGLELLDDMAMRKKKEAKTFD